MGYVIDSNVLSELRKPKCVEQVAGWFRQIAPSELFTSVLVLAELRHGLNPVGDTCSTDPGALSGA